MLMVKSWEEGAALRAELQLLLRILDHQGKEGAEMEKTHIPGTAGLA